jgi:nucleolar protein 14
MSKGRSKNKAHRSSSSLPKGIPHKRGRGGGGGAAAAAAGGGVGVVNPFETARSTNSALRVKHPVHNKSVPGQNKLRPTTTSTGANGTNSVHLQSSLAKSIARRKQHLSHQILNEGKANVFIDRRIGESSVSSGGVGAYHSQQQSNSQEDVMLKRIVQERIRRSKKRDKFHLTDDDDDDDDNNYSSSSGNGGGLLTHRGQIIDEHYTGAPIDHRDVVLSDDDDGEDLDKVDTMLHFGGGKFDSMNRKERSAYGSSSGGGGELGQVYRSRREELEDRIQMKKMLKAEKLKRKEDQAETFDTMDESFAELAQLLQFRDKEQERIQRATHRKNGTLSTDDVEMDDWDREMKEYLFTKKVKATDRTKTPEEIAKEEAERLHKLESKRLARMAGDFLSEDEFSDISVDGGGDGGSGGGNGAKRKRREREKKDKNGKKKAKKGDHHSNPEELSDSDDDDDEGNVNDKKREVRFTADGLMYVDKQGNVLGKVGDEEEDDEEDPNSDGEEDSDDDSNEEDEDDSSDADGHNLGDTDDEASAAVDDDDDDDDDASSDEDNVPAEDTVELKEGMAIQGNYHANEQFENKGTNWFNGTITSVRKAKNGQVLYDVTYDDGDFEEGMVAENIRPLPKSMEEKERDEKKKTEVEIAKQKKQKAKLRAK